MITLHELIKQSQTIEDHTGNVPVIASVGEIDKVEIEYTWNDSAVVVIKVQA